MTSSLNASRRLFLQQAGALSTLGVAATPLALNLAAIGSAAAQSAGDYKAIVCLFLFGGNDAFNMVLPTDATSFANYTAVRNQAPDSIALLAPGTAPNLSAAAGSPARLGGVLPIVPLRSQGRTFALHPAMAAAQALFQGTGGSGRRLAIVPNVGPLIVPTTKAQHALASHPRPPSLYSHNDQQNYWQSFRAEGATQGWGGRMGDMLASGNGRAVFTAISTSGNAVWLSGQQVRQYQVGTTGAVRMGATDMTGRIFGSDSVGAAMHQVVRATRGGHVFERDLADVNARSIDAEVALRSALSGLGANNPLFGTPPASGSYNANNDPKLCYASPLNGATTFNPLAQQLQTVARLVQAAPAVEARRQVFFVGLGGFDTHDTQNRNHAELMAKLAHALAYFDATLGAMGKRNNVTLFTASDFGRTFTSNGDGTDHGWGAHHFVMGGAVRGGDLYGSFPTLGTKNANNNGFDSSPDQLGNGTLLPTTSVDQLGATLARWFGVSASECLDVFPNLGNFSTRDLGFMS